MSSARENVPVISHLFISILPCSVARGRMLLPKTIARREDSTHVQMRILFQFAQYSECRHSLTAQRRSNRLNDSSGTSLRNCGAGNRPTISQRKQRRKIVAETHFSTACAPPS